MPTAVEEAVRDYLISLGLGFWPEMLVFVFVCLTFFFCFVNVRILCFVSFTVLRICVFYILFVFIVLRMCVFYVLVFCNKKKKDSHYGRLNWHQYWKYGMWRKNKECDKKCDNDSQKNKKSVHGSQINVTPS